MGASGKSAQFPLHTWLPDAMEGPTPVSALIHAATMVTAGVYLVARCTPLFALAPEAQLTVGCIGGFTALFAALIALTQNDLKRVLAYSTLSQLGYMFLALGCAVAGGARGLVVFAVVAAIFHLFTHAFFKALLFLSAGSVMHAMGNVIDMRRFGGLRRVLPVTHWTFLAGALALAGFPGLAGFWSKDEAIGAAHQAGETSDRFGGVYYLLFVSAVATAFLTAFYTFRAYFMTFWGELRVPPEAGSHGHADHGDAHGHGHDPHATAHPEPAAGHAGGGVAHESPPVMTVPLIILAVFALGVGAALGPTGLFEHLLGSASIFAGFAEPPHELDWPLMGISAVVALAGIGLAWLMYVRQPELPGKLATSARALYQLSYNKFHVDELYDYFLIKPLEGVAQFCRIFDLYVVDSLVDIIGNLPRLLGALFRPVQNGLVQFYALAMVLGLTVFLVALVRWM
jgi:NADH-quinone oxidoreductase subunit L